MLAAVGHAVDEHPAAEELGARYFADRKGLRPYSLERMLSASLR